MHFVCVLGKRHLWSPEASGDSRLLCALRPVVCSVRNRRPWVLGSGAWGRLHAGIIAMKHRDEWEKALACQSREIRQMAEQLYVWQTVDKKNRMNGLCSATTTTTT